MGLMARFKDWIKRHLKVKPKGKEVFLKKSKKQKAVVGTRFLAKTLGTNTFKGQLEEWKIEEVSKDGNIRVGKYPYTTDKYFQWLEPFPLKVGTKIKLGIWDMEIVEIL